MLVISRPRLPSGRDRLGPVRNSDRSALLQDAVQSNDKRNLQIHATALEIQPSRRRSRARRPASAIIMTSQTMAAAIKSRLAASRLRAPRKAGQKASRSPRQTLILVHRLHPLCSLSTDNCLLKLGFSSAAHSERIATNGAVSLSIFRPAIFLSRFTPFSPSHLFISHLS